MNTSRIAAAQLSSQVSDQPNLEQLPHKRIDDSLSNCQTTHTHNLRGWAYGNLTKPIITGGKLAGVGPYQSPLKVRGSQPNIVYDLNEIFYNISY